MKKKFVLLKAVLICVSFVSLLGYGGELHANQDNEATTSKRRIINPWTWQEKFGLFGFVHANEVTAPRRLLFTAGQVSVDDDGNLLYPNNMAKQIDQVINNLETILEQAGFQLSDVVRFTYYTTDVQMFKSTAVQQVLGERLGKAGCKPATSLIGVKELFHPDCVIEIEATVAD